MLPFGCLGITKWTKTAVAAGAAVFVGIGRQKAEAERGEYYVKSCPRYTVA